MPREIIRAGPLNPLYSPQSNENIAVSLNQSHLRACRGINLERLAGRSKRTALGNQIGLYLLAGRAPAKSSGGSQQNTKE